MKRLVALLSALTFAQPAHAEVYRYVVIANINNSKLLIQGVYEDFIVDARPYCWEAHGFGQGEVIFSSHNLRACVTATFISARTGNACEVWCP